MTRASALDAAARSDTAVGSASDSNRQINEDRRLTDSNQAWLGKVVDGRYRVLEVIGRGGMGVVYRVEHLRMGKVAAMKVLHRDLASDPDVIGRFEREAAAISKLHHPHTVQVFDFGTAGDALYLIMEFVRGVDLARMIERDGAMSWSRAAPLLAQVCSALQEAHELGIVHRDLKPENVLITRTAGGRDYAKVLDFGLAKLEQRAPSTMTDRQQIVGTPYFMSPEQIRGDDVDARSDIYSFGALMFELLTAQHLFQASTAVGVLTKHLTAEPDAPSMRAPKAGIDPQVDHLCRKALAKDPANRWQSAAELATAIEDVFSETVGYGTGPGQRSKPIRRPLVLDQHVESDIRLRRSDIDAFERGLRRQKYFTLMLMLALVLGGAAAAVWFAMRTPPPLREESEPNNDGNHANVIAANTEVTGYIGKRMSTQDGDRDTFIVKWPAGSRRVVSVKVSGLPNLDVNLSVVDGDGMHGAQSDDSGIGEGEVLHRRLIDGPLVVTVGQTVAKSQLPIENVSDAYKLTVIEEKLVGETEPNATEPDANALELTQELRGYLDARNDVDQLRWTGADGDYNVVVRADGLPLTWRLSDGMLRTPGSARVTLKRGELIQLERTDRVGSGTLTGRDVMWSIVVMPGQ
jgi:eukaryotic-like serine/threonine-protein kinase